MVKVNSSDGKLVTLPPSFANTLLNAVRFHRVRMFPLCIDNTVVIFGGLLGRSGLSLPTPLPRLLLPAHHSMLGDVISREKFRWTASFLDPPMFPDLRIEEQGRIVEPALGRTALVTVAVVLTLALAPLTVRSLSGRERRRRSSSRSLSSHERSRSSDRSRSRRVRSRSRGDRSRSSDRYRSRRDRSRSSDCYRSRRQRSRSLAHRGARGHAISLVVLVTTRDLVDDLLPLTVRGQRREDDEPDVSGRRVWRWLLSPRLLLSLKWLL